MVVPIGTRPHTQTLFLFVRKPDGSLSKERLAPVRFVPLIGDSDDRDATGR